MEKSDFPPVEKIVSVVESLTESVPVDYLLKTDSVNMIADKLRSSVHEAGLSKEQINVAVKSMDIVDKDEMMQILDVVIDKMFDPGSD